MVYARNIERYTFKLQTDRLSEMQCVYLKLHGNSAQTS